MDIFFLLSIFFGVALIVVYIYQTLRNPCIKKEPDLADGVVLFLSGAGVAAGIKVCYIAFDSNACSAIGDERTYIFLVGIAVIWVSVQMIVKIIAALFPEKSEIEPDVQEDDTK